MDFKLFKRAIFLSCLFACGSASGLLLLWVRYYGTYPRLIRYDPMGISLKVLLLVGTTGLIVVCCASLFYTLQTLEVLVEKKKILPKS
jgi:hypothetical protein